MHSNSVSLVPTATDSDNTENYSRLYDNHLSGGTSNPQPPRYRALLSSISYCAPENSIVWWSPTVNDPAASSLFLISQLSPAHWSAVNLSSVIRKLSKRMLSDIDQSSSPMAPYNDIDNITDYLYSTTSFSKLIRPHCNFQAERSTLNFSSTT